MDKQTEMNKMMNQYLEHTYKDKNVLKVQKCRWNKRLQNKDFKGSDLSLMNMLEFMIYQKNIYNNFIKFIMFNNSINMPVKTGKDKGLLTTGEIRKLISAHNKLSKIVVPKGTDREGLEKLIKSNGYKINHKEQRLDPSALNRPPQKTVTMPPKKLTEKQKAKQESQKASLKIFLDNSAKAKKEFDKKMSAKKVAVVKPSDKIFEIEDPNYAFADRTASGKIKDKSKQFLKIKSVEMYENHLKRLTIKFNKLNEQVGGFWSNPTDKRNNDKFKTLFEKMRSPAVLSKMSKFFNEEKPSQSFNVKNTKVAQVKNKPPPVKKVSLPKPPKKDLYKLSKEAQKKLDYDEQIEERLKKLNDNLISNKNVLSGSVGNQQGDFMKLFTEIYKLGRGIVPKDFSSKSIKYATNLLNIVYSNPPKDREGLIMPEQAFKTSAKGDGIFRPWRAYLSETSEKKRRKVMKGYNEDKKPVVKKPVEDTKQAQEGENRIDIYGTQGDKKRLIVKQDKTFDTIKSLLDKDGYIMTKQQEDLFNGNIVNYVKEQKKPARINIKPAKGKTDMMIISIEGHSFGQGAASIRIKKKEVKKPVVKKESVKLKVGNNNEDLIVRGLSNPHVKVVIKIIKDKIKEIIDKSIKNPSIVTNQYIDDSIEVVDGIADIYEEKNKIEFKFKNAIAGRPHDLLYETPKGDMLDLMRQELEKLKPAVKKPAVKKESVKKVSVKKPPTEEVFTDSEEEEYEPREITAMNDPLTKKLIEGTKSIRNTIKKDAKDDPSKITNMKVIIKMVKPIREFVRKLQLNNNVEFSEKIIIKFEDDFIENFIDDLKEIGGLKQPASMVVNQMVKEEEADE